MEGGSELLFPGSLRGREGSGDTHAVGWERPRAQPWGWGGFFSSADGGGAPRSARPPGSRCGDRGVGHHCAAAACYWLAGGGLLTEKRPRLGAGGEGRSLYVNEVGVRPRGLLGWGHGGGGVCLEAGAALESAVQG